jgi:hypothetical protein
MSNDEYWFIIIILSLLLVIYYLCNFFKKRQLKSKDEEIIRLKYKNEIDLKNERTQIEQKYADEFQELNKKCKALKSDLNNCLLSTLKSQENIQLLYNGLTKEHSDTFSYVSSLMSDYLTYNIHIEELSLKTSPKYHERQRAVKIREIREETEKIIIPLKEAQYQLDYLLQLYPELNEVINYQENFSPPLDEIKKNKEIYNDDPVSSYISREEWDNLSPTERNQLALDRYISRNKSNWEIGRDYELYVAYRFERRGYKVDTFGSYMKLNDLGRDLIAKKDKKIKVVQCKYWSSQKVIHENHICQLFGTVICYCIENNLKTSDVEPVFITSTILSEQAKKFADMLKITVLENFPLKEFPRIKCNIGHDEYGKTYIYHLPMDQLYDKVQISKKEERYCATVAEAEALGFRRAYKWHGN